MKNLPVTLTRVVNSLTTVAAALLPVLAEQHVISGSTAAMIGGIITTLALGHKGTVAAGNYAAKTPAVPPA
jgi:hypothetical protein